MHDDDREHVISLVLNHEDWQEFVKVQPEPVNWLRERILETIAANRLEPVEASSSASAAAAPVVFQ